MSTMEKTKAVDAAMSQIERQFGKGSIMKLGSRACRGAHHFHRIPGPGSRPSVSAAFPGKGSGNLRSGIIR